MMRLFRSRGPVVCHLRCSSANLPDENRYLLVEEIGAVYLYVVSTTFCNDPSAYCGEVLEILLHLIPHRRVIPFQFRWDVKRQRSIRVMRENQNRDIAKWPRVN